MSLCMFRNILKRSFSISCKHHATAASFNRAHDVSNKYPNVHVHWCLRIVHTAPDCVISHWPLRYNEAFLTDKGLRALRNTVTYDQYCDYCGQNVLPLIILVGPSNLLTWRFVVWNLPQMKYEGKSNENLKSAKKKERKWEPTISSCRHSMTAEQCEDGCSLGNMHEGGTAFCHPFIG
jgi:hypothetical protein